MSKIIESIFDKPVHSLPAVEPTGVLTPEEEEAMFVGGEPKPTEPVILSEEDSRRIWELVRSREPVVFTSRTLEAIANYKRLMSEVVD